VKEKHFDDFELVQKALKGDRFAFGTIVRRYEFSVAKTVMGMLGNTQEAEDVGQEVFIRFYRSMKQYKGDSALSTYLIRIAINLSLNAIKKQKKRKTGDLDKIDFQLKDEDYAEKADNAEIIEQALAKLPPDYRSVVVLRLIDGYSTKETAQLLKIPLGTVLSRLSRAQIKLKEILKTEYTF